MGSGDVARMITAMDAQDREARRRKAPAEDPEAAALVAYVEAYCDEVTRTMRAHLEAHGCHRHDRGRWRKRRNG